MDLKLQTDVIYQNKLDVKTFGNLLNDVTQGYKFYWLEAIVELSQKESFSFDEVVNKMIFNAWYSVNEYNLRLGAPVSGSDKNWLELLAKEIKRFNNLSAKSSGIEIDNAISGKVEYTEEQKFSLSNYTKVINMYKNNLIKEVPYRLLAPFIEIGGNNKLWNNKTKLIEYISLVSKDIVLPYTIENGKSLSKRVIVNPYWRELIKDNQSIILNWINFNKICYLQERNLGVPGIVYKVNNEFDKARKLKEVRKLWDLYSSVLREPIIDIYIDKPLSEGYELDHFIPWHYVAHNEIWNLLPMDGGLNSSKSNKLPDWDAYFPKLVDRQFMLYSAVKNFDILRKQFDKCRKDNLQSIWANDIYDHSDVNKAKFEFLMRKYLKPEYENAVLNKFKKWNIPKNLIRYQCNYDATYKVADNAEIYQIIKGEL